MKFIDSLLPQDLAGKRVLLRTGFDMGKNFGAMEDFRIKAGMKSISFLLTQGANVLILNHNGRPEGKVDPGLSNATIAKKLAELLGREVPLLPLAQRAIAAPIAVLENLRFDPREEAGDMSFARELAQLGDIYVNDAFASCHRAHTSMVLLPFLLPHYGGIHLKKEVEALTQARDYPEHPLLLIIGGAKVETKMKIVKNFWEKADEMIVGGILANTMLHAQGVAIGKSLIEEEYLKDLGNIPITDTRLHLPADVRVATNLEGTQGVRVAAIGNLHEDEIILDIGPDTEFLFDNIIKSARMIIWNGPIGKYEIQAFSQGTIHLVNSLLESGAHVITGGGETVEFLEARGLLDTFAFVSTGGGAMLSFLAGDPMPALDALEHELT